MDFITLAEYRSHDEETLEYIEYTLNKINKSIVKHKEYIDIY